jgi:hypothetical protein
VSQLATDIFQAFPHLLLITRFVTRLTRRVPLVEQELLTLPVHLSLPCRSSLFVLLSFFFWPLCCLLFFDLRILITLLVLSNFSISCHDHKRKMVHVINSSSKVHTLHTGKTIQENAINCKRQEVDDKILSITVQMYIIYKFSMIFYKVILEKDAIDS